MQTHNTIKKKFGSRLTKAWFLELRKKFNTDVAMGRALGVSRQCIHQHREKFGLGAVKGRNVDRNKEMHTRFISGESGISIGKAFGVSYSQTYRCIKEVQDEIEAEEERNSPKPMTPIEKALEYAN